MSKLYRQGDILFKKIDEIPKKAKKIETDVIVEGEATGHAHKIVNGFIFQTWNEMFIEAKTGAEIVHDEHDPIALEPGYYEVIRQKEYDPTFIDPRYVED